MRNVAAKRKKTPTQAVKKTGKPSTRTKTANKEPGIETKKTRKKQEKKPVREDAEIEIVNGNIDFCDTKLNARQFMFLIYYLTPGQPCFHKAEQAAIKAGYAESTARVDAYRMIHEPEIEKIIKANDKLSHLALQETANRAIEIKKQRAFFNPLDYFTIGTVETRYGEKQSVKLKPMKEMTEDQRMCIDGLDLKGQSSEPVYVLPNREKELDDILKMDAEQQKIMNNNDEEETMEIILERMAIRERKRAQYPEGYIDSIVESPASDSREINTA